MWLERPSSSAATAHAKLATNCIASENSSLLSLAPIVLEQAREQALQCALLQASPPKSVACARFLGSQQRAVAEIDTARTALAEIRVRRRTILSRARPLFYPELGIFWLVRAVRAVRAGSYALAHTRYARAATPALAQTAAPASCYSSRTLQATAFTSVRASLQTRSYCSQEL